MRMHPGVGFPLERYVPPEGATLCDVDLSGGTIVSMSGPVLHMDKTVFGHDADRFCPERWIEASPEQLRLMERSFFAVSFVHLVPEGINIKSSLLQFGHGARTCIGKNISILEMGKFIPQIFRHFDLEWASSEPEWKTEAAWFWKQSGLLVRFKLRGE
jgi:cytochrome P450